MSEHIRKSHNVSVLIYHIVCPAKYRKSIFNKEIDLALKGTCIEIADRFEISFLQIGTDKDHVHFLIQSVPTYSPKKIVQIIKSITAREMFRRHPEVKKQLWGGEFWSDGYYVSTVGQHASEHVIQNYVKNQGTEKEYEQLHQQRFIF